MSGTPVVGSVLKLQSPLHWVSPDPLKITYTWERCTTSSVTSCSHIPLSTTTSHYIVAAADVGSYLTFAVTASDKEHQSTTLTALPIGPVT